MLLRTHGHHPLSRLVVIVIGDSDLLRLVDGGIVGAALAQDAAAIAAVVIVVVVVLGRVLDDRLGRAHGIHAVVVRRVLFVTAIPARQLDAALGV